MKGIPKNQWRYLILCLILFLFLYACGGVSPDNGSSGTDPPTISSFTSTSTSITEGESVTLSWVTNASAVSIDQGIGTVTAPSGSTTVTPASTTTYTLMATNSAGSSTNSIIITVSPDETIPSSAPVINSFTPSSFSITEGDNVTLFWVTTGATTVYLKQVSGTGSSTGTVALSGSKTVSPSDTTTYNLTASNSAGSDTETITITVNPAAVIEQTITIQPGPEGNDSYIYGGYPDDNFGNINWVGIGHIVTWGSFRAYLQFNLSDLPAGAVISNAVLKLYQYNYQDPYGSPQNFDLGVYRVNGVWGENAITWNTRPGYKSTPESTFSVTPDAVTWLSWDITSLVQGWLSGSTPNYGVVLRDTDETAGNIFIECYSSDYTDNSSRCPKLEVTYYVP